MGGMVDCGVTLDSKTSPRRAAIEKAQEELRLEYDVREERRRELEFLEKGGNPLDFKFSNVASLSVQSTSLNVTSEAKGSFALAPSPHGGDSVESSGPNMADNLLLLDGDNSNPGSSGLEKSSNINNKNGNGNNAREQEEPGILRFARRNRSRPSNNNAVRPAVLPSNKDNAKPCTNETSKSVQPEEGKERERGDNPVLVSPEKISNSKPGSPMKCETIVKTVQPEEMSVVEGEVKLMQMDVDARAEETEIKNIEKIGEKDEALISSVKNEKEETEMDAAVSNGTDTRCNDELTTAPSAPVNDDTTDGKGVFPSGSTPDNGLNENEEALGIATGSNAEAEELDSKAVEKDPSNPVPVQSIIKDEKEEEEVRVEKPSGNETAAAEDKSKEDSSMVEVEPALDEAEVVPPHLISEVAEAAPNVEVAKEVVEKENEDEILGKARIIEANLKRAEGMPLSRLGLEKRRKSHWDFVLEEMAWLANDFMQERLWKTAAASQLSKWITCGGRQKFEEANLQRRQRNLAKTVAKFVMGFWHTVDTERKQGKSCMKDDSNNSRQSLSSVKSYAFRVLDLTSDTLTGLVPAEAPTTPDRPYDKGVLLILEQLPEESLFYTVPPGALQAYRESIEAQFAQFKKTGIAANQDDCETSNSVADISRENAYEEDEVQNGVVCGGYEGGFSPRFSKKRKHPDSSHQKAYPHVSLQEPYNNTETKPPTRTQLLLPNGKRPLHSPNIVIIPAKKVRTQVPNRKQGPQIGSGAMAVPTTGITKMDASSDTNSYQEERTSLQHCESFSRKTVEVESPVSRGPSHDDNMVVVKSKKKKIKHPEQVYSGPGKSSMFEHRSHGDAGRLHDQKDHLKNRIESHQIDNGNNGMYGQHGPRKPKISPSQQEGVGLTGGAISTGPSHNGSSSKQMIKIVNRGVTIRKGKGAKLAATHTGPGSTWSSFEDQNLVVLVHDLGPNWELISDVINSTLSFKCKHRRAKECKERHQSLMETSTLDGADSADDSGSSQPYTQLRGIPKGTARHLFQKLRGPMEEDTIKSHFEKIISLSQKLRPRKSQEGKQVPPAHNSHVVALSQVSPNNSSGTILTPLDLSDAPGPSTEMPQVIYGSGHTNGIPSQGQQQGSSMGAPSILPPPTSNMNPVMQGSPGLVLPGTLPSPSNNQINAPNREQQQRMGMPRGGPMLQPDEQQQHQQRMQMQQQYTHMVSNRGIISGPLPPTGVDRGGGTVRMLPPGGGGSNGININNGMNNMMQLGSGLTTRGMPPVARPGFQRLNSPGMLNMVSSSPSPGNMQAPMNPMLRPRDSMQLLRPGQNMDEHSRQMMMQEMQLQQQNLPSQNNNNNTNNGGTQFAPGPTSSISSNPTTSPPVQSFPPMQTHTPHAQMFSNHPTPQQQAYAIHFAKERQMQQQKQQQQQQQQQRMMPSVQQSPNLQAQKNLPEGSGAGSGSGTGTKKQKQTSQPRQSNQSGKGIKGRGGGNIAMHQTLAGPGSTVLNASPSAQPSTTQSNKLYPSPSPTPIVPLGSASGTSNQQENVNGNNDNMLIGQRPSGLVGGAHWQPKNQVQNNTSNNNNSNRSVVHGNVYGQPSNSGPG